MKEHQRYFPVKSNEGELLPYFVGVRNGDSFAIDNVIKGNEKVLYARLSDGQFFYEEDQKHSIDHYLQKLKRVVFQEKLGTISDKIDRIVYITKQLSLQLNLDKSAIDIAVRSAEISKFDLVTNMVNEFTELQGIIGGKYARFFGEDPAVAKAIGEQYLPKQANGQLPDSLAGSIISVADKLDTIVGCISIGLMPTGSQDPYGLRRQAVGVLRIMQENQWDISVETLLEITQGLYRTLDIEQNDQENVSQALHEFFQLRTTYLLKEKNIEQDVIQAVIHKEVGILGYTMAKAKVLSEKRNDDHFKQIQEALVRVLNLSDKANQSEVDPALFVTESEAALFTKYQAVCKDYQAASDKNNATKALNLLGELAAPIHDFFDGNMVMADDEQLKNNRLSLVRKIALLVNDYADLTAIEWKQHF